MFNFLKRANVRAPSPEILRALALTPSADVSSEGALMMVTSRGQYSGRRVTFIRVFDARQARANGIEIRSAADLDQHPELVVRTGHLESDGTIVLATAPGNIEAPGAPRTTADRALHAEDESLVNQSHPGA